MCIAEYIGQNTLSMTSNAIGFKLIETTAPIVTILTAKSSQRYRLQSDDFPSLNIMVQEVMKRLQAYYSNKESFKISYSTNLPITDVIKYIGGHFKISQNISNLEVCCRPSPSQIHRFYLQKELSLLSDQFRLIQKRLIMKFKQKNPTSLSNLDVLLQDTYQDISNVMINLEKEKYDLNEAQIRLSSALELICTLLKLMDTDKDIEIVEAALCACVHDMENQVLVYLVLNMSSVCYLLELGRCSGCFFMLFAKNDSSKV